MPLFGRAEPLAAATRALDAAAAGRGGTFVVAGEAGIGKSALARSLADDAEARGARVGFGRAWEVGGAPAYWPWTQALGDLGLDLDELLGSVSGAMGSAQRLVAFDRVVRAVSAVEGSPVVVVLDDLHAADVASLELALAFSRAVARKRILLVVTTRESELRERRELGELVGKLVRESTHVPLRRLDADATASWLKSVGFKGDPSEVHRLSEGNPLFIEEAMRLGVDRFANAAAGGAAVVLTEHLARISDSTREALTLAAAIGREAALDDIAALGERTLDDVEAAAREGQLAGILEPVRDGSLAFSHMLLRDALYDALPASRRSALHARIAQRIESRGGPPAIVAKHLLAAGDAVDAARVARAVCIAAESAVAKHAADSALELIAAARSRLAGRLDEATTLALDLVDADATMQSAPSDDARARSADCAARAKRLGLPIEQARAAIAHGREILTGRIDSVMIGLLEDALAVVPPNDHALRAQILSRLACALSPPDSEAVMKRVAEYAREAIAIARDLDDIPALLHTLLWSAHALLYAVPLHERVELTTEIVALAREQGADLILASIGGFHAMSLIEMGRPVAARHEAESFIRLVESLPVAVMQWRAVAMRATLAALEEQLDDARRLADEVKQHAPNNMQAAVGSLLFEISFSVCFDDKERMAAIVAAPAVLAARTVLLPFMSCANAMIGRSDLVRATFESALEGSRGLPPALALSQAAIYLGVPELAELCYARLIEVASFGRFFASGYFPLGSVSRVLGELAFLRGDHDRARQHLDEAIAECHEMQCAPLLKMCEAARARIGGPPPPSRRSAKRAPEMTVTLAHEGDVWQVTPSTGAPFRIKHSKGMDYLDHLLTNPGREVYVLALAGAGEGPEDAGAILDERAKQAYRQRVEELEDQLAEAEQMGDRGRATKAREELEAVADQLAAAVGLGGRDRKAASNVERARVNVQRRIKDVIRRIGENDAALGRYLEATVRTGTYCVFNPV